MHLYNNVSLEIERIFIKFFGPAAAKRFDCIQIYIILLLCEYDAF